MRRRATQFFLRDAGHAHGIGRRVDDARRSVRIVKDGRPVSFLFGRSAFICHEMPPDRAVRAAFFTLSVRVCPLQYMNGICAACAIFKV